MALPKQSASTAPHESEFDGMISCNQKLRELGIDHTIKTPQICVVGAQNSDKILLVEALCRIKIPPFGRDFLRCPLAIDISPGEPQNSKWQCQVFIEERYDCMYGTAAREVTSLGQWRKRKSCSYIWGATENVAEASDLVKAAQQLILSPGKNGLLNPPQIDHFAFSPNIVRLKITQPGLPTLSLIDLSDGISRYDYTEDAHSIPLADLLVKEYVRDVSNVVLLTTTTITDLNISRAQKIVQELEAASRTVEVLTKPDSTQFFSLQEFMDIEHPNTGFPMNRRIVMMDSHLKAGESEAMMAEATVFAAEPWCWLKEANERLGVTSLRRHLQKLLAGKISDNLPRNLGLIESRLSEIYKLLARLTCAPDPGDIPLLTERLIAQLADQIRSTFELGAHERQQSLMMRWNDLASEFKAHITGSYPTIGLRSRDDDSRLNLVGTRKARKPSKVIEQHSITGEVIDISDDEVPTKFATSNEKTNKAGANNSTDDPECRYHFKLEEVRNFNQALQMVGMPHQADPEVLRDMKMKSLSKWEKPLHKFMYAVGKLLVSRIKAIVQSVFSKYQRFPFYTAIMDWVKQYLDEVINAEWSRTESILRVEQETPYTLDIERQTARYDQNLAEKVKKRNEVRLRVMRAELEAKGTKINKKQLTIDALGPDEFKVEIEMAAHVRAYYHIAASRFVDNICQGVVSHLFTACSNKLAANLKEFIGADRREQRVQLLDWFTEPSKVQRQREDLIKERDQLLEGKMLITDALRSVKDATERTRASNAKHKRVSEPEPVHDDAADPQPTTTSPESAAASTTLKATPSSTRSKRSAPEDFNGPMSTGKRLSGVSKLSLRESSSTRDEGSPDAATTKSPSAEVYQIPGVSAVTTRSADAAKTSYPRPTVSDVGDEDEGSAFL